MADYYCIVTFHSTSQALTFEKVMKENKVGVKLMPVPRQVSSSCGTAAQIPCDLKNEIIKICLEQNIEIDEIHEIEGKQGSGIFSKLLKNTIR